MQLANLAEMVTINGQGNSQGKQPGPANKRPAQQFPIMNPLLTENTQPVDRPQEGQDVFELKVRYLEIRGRLTKYSSGISPQLGRRLN
jgi:hypothetical protein